MSDKKLFRTDSDPCSYVEFQNIFENGNCIELAGSMIYGELSEIGCEGEDWIELAHETVCMDLR
jgi:hypothetical protein